MIFSVTDVDGRPDLGSSLTVSGPSLNRPIHLKIPDFLSAESPYFLFSKSALISDKDFLSLT